MFYNLKIFVLLYVFICGFTFKHFQYFPLRFLSYFYNVFKLFKIQIHLLIKLCTFKKNLPASFFMYHHLGSSNDY